MDIESPFERIARTRAAFKAKHGPAGDDLVAEIDRQLEARIVADPLFQFAALEFEKAERAMRIRAIEAAQKAADNGVTAALGALDARMWHGRILDLFISELKPGEKLLEVHWWKLVTTLRTRTYHELKAGCRMSVETNDAYFERNFDSDATRHAAEAAERERTNPPAPQYGRNLDFPNGVRPGR